MDLPIIAAGAAVLFGLPGIVGASHLGLLAVASWFYRERRSSGSRMRFLILVPAHNEEKVIGEALTAIMRERRPSDLVLVVADRCTDRTAEIARSCGATVLERGPDSVPGRAAARQAGLEYARGLEWDAVLMLDADSVIESGFLAACERAFTADVAAIQARSESGKGRSLAAEASVAAFTLQGITIPRGRDRLGLSVRLRGTGMAIRRNVALAHRFTAPASEDLFFTLDLLLDGHRCRHVDSARLRSLGASNWQTFGGQKVRYEAGRIAAARAYVPALLKRAVVDRDAVCFEAAWFLCSPPFAAGAASLLLAAAVSLVIGLTPLVTVFGAGLGMLMVSLLTGLIQARASLRTWLALATAPWYLAWKAVVQLRAVASVLRRDQYYGPTARI